MGVLYLTRPLDRVRLSCFVWMDMLDRRPFRRSVRKFVNHFEAIVNGIPSRIVDVSAEGLRIELPKDHRSVLPSAFSCGCRSSVSTSRHAAMWMRTSSGQTVWCGGAIADNRASATQGWCAFVDMVPAPVDAANPVADGPR